MIAIFTIGLYIITLVLLAISVAKSREKTTAALKKAWKAFENILPQFLAIIILIGFLLVLLEPATISRTIGRQSGWLGIFIASAVGSLTLIPGFVAFPLAAALLKSGAGLSQITVFISTLMMVGIVTIPLEIKYFGKKATFLRNSLAYLFSFVVAAAIGLLLGGGSI